MLTKPVRSRLFLAPWEGTARRIEVVQRRLNPYVLMKDVRVFYCVQNGPSTGHKAKEPPVSLPKYYSPNTAEPQLQAFCQQTGTYHFSPGAQRSVYSIDIHPPTVSGNCHLDPA